MKIRINGNFVRLRLNQLEVDQLKENGKVIDVINFGNNALRYCLQSNPEAQQVSVRYEDHSITVAMPPKLATQWVETDLVGFENEDQTHVRILVEKDFQCLHKRPGEDESENFPNPLA